MAIPHRREEGAARPPLGRGRQKWRGAEVWVIEGQLSRVRRRPARYGKRALAAVPPSGLTSSDALAAITALLSQIVVDGGPVRGPRRDTVSSLSLTPPIFPNTSHCEVQCNGNPYTVMELPHTETQTVTL